MSIDTTRYITLSPRQPAYLAVLGLLALLVAAGLYCAYNMEHAGHYITGMNNRIVWGLPHVFAVTLIVAASGALNAASFASVFGASAYKPYARLSVVLALSLLAGGLAVLVLDLGRPDRLIVAMTHFNFRSIFAWNIFIYTGFMLIGVLYLWMMMEKRFNRLTTRVGTLAFVWRLLMTTGTGSIFGFLVGRNALDTAVMAPLFIALSLVLGTAVFVLLLALIHNWKAGSAEAPLDEAMLRSLRRLLLWFIIAVAYFSVVHHLTNIYIRQHHMVEQHMLTGPFSLLFWFGHIGIGVLLPLWLLLSAQPEDHARRLQWASLSSFLGGMALLYSVIIGSQSTAQVLFPGKTVLSSSFGDLGFASYSASVWEWGLGVGGVALALLLFFAAMRILPCTPDQS